MKRPIALLTVGIVLFLSGVLFVWSTACADTSESITVRYSFSPPEIANSGKYYNVTIPGLDNGGEPGKPSLPLKTARLAVPVGRRAIAYSVTPGYEVVIGNGYKVQPVQLPFPLSRPELARETPPDEQLYRSAVMWPPSICGEAMLQKKMGYTVFVLNLNPVNYFPEDGSISYYKWITVELETVSSKEKGTLSSASAEGRATVEAMVDNPGDVMAQEQEGGMGVDNLPQEGSYEHVIITTEALKNASATYTFQDLSQHKIGRGVSSTIVTVEWIYGNYAGADQQEKIRNFIIDAYNNWGTRYVLLGGVDNGTNRVPARKFWVQSWADGYTAEMPSDMYYGCLDGNFNYDGDDRYGEPNDGPGGGEVDLFAEVYVGRAAVDSPSEMANFVKKTIAYETSSSEYLRNIYMIGEHLGFGGVSEYAKDSMEEIRLGSCANGYCTKGFTEPDFFETQTLYDADGTWAKVQLTGIMDSGVYVLNHLGHANYTSDMKLSTSDLSGLSNNHYFFAYSQGCMPGGFDTANCFAETITSMEHGAFAVVMNARYGWGSYNSTAGPSQHYDRQFWDAIFDENITELGKMNADSKEDNVGLINNSCMRWCCYELNLFGDPETQMLRVSSKGSVGLNQKVYTPDSSMIITVMDTDLDEDPFSRDTTSVEIESNTETTPEVVRLMETGNNSKTFTGTIGLITGSPSADGSLQVTHGDTITVTYQDGNDGTGETGLATATATVDALAPYVSNVVSNPGTSTCTITWTTNEESNSLVHYGTSLPLAHESSSATETTSHAVTLSGLSPSTLYHYEVISADAAGNATVDNNSGQYYQFRSLEPAGILLVDDDQGESLEAYYTEALEANGYSYDTWCVESLNATPSGEALALYDIVIWNTGYDYYSEGAGLSLNEQQALMSYLDGGGRLLLSGQDILYNGVCAEFQLDYLHFANYSSDDQTSSIRGVGGDPVGEGISLSLSYPFDNWADSVLPGTDAAGIFQTDGSTIFDYCAIRYPASGWGQFRVVFFVFPFEAIGSAGGAPNNRAAIMHRVVSWLSLSAPTPTPTIPPDQPPSDPGDGTPPAPGTIRVSLNGMHFAPGDLLKALVYVPYIPSEEKMDGYAVVQGPGITLSVVGGNVLVPGVEPIIKGARGIPSYEGLLLQRIIPETAPRGSYCISLGTLPSGLEPRAKSTLDTASVTFQIE